MRTLAVHPVNTMYARYLAEMLGIMGDYGQPKMTSSNSYKNIEWKNSIHVSVSIIKPLIEG